MKKKIMTIALALAVLGGIQAGAKNNDNTTTTCTQQTEQSCPAKKARDGKSPRMDKQQRAFFSQQAFDGIQLTDAQKAGLKALDEQQQAKRQEMKAQKESAKAEARQQKQQNDSTMRASRQQAKRDYLNGVKSVLTPDQYVVFLENIVVEGPAQQQGMQARHGQKQMKARDGRQGKHDRASMGSKDAKGNKDRRQSDRPMAGKAMKAKDAKGANS